MSHMLGLAAAARPLRTGRDADAVEAVFSEAVGRNFEVVVVDSAPAFAGRRLLNALYAKRVRTTYVRLTAAAPEIERATLVVLGADAVFSNGSILARSGAFAVAALAQRRGPPQPRWPQRHRGPQRQERAYQLG